MTLENLKREHAHLKWLASGDFVERDFDFKIPKSENEHGDSKHQGEGGWSTMGEMKPERRQLIQGDAIGTLARFEKKHPEFIKVVDKSTEINFREPMTKPKSKEKKDGN